MIERRAFRAAPGGVGRAVGKPNQIQRVLNGVSSSIGIIRRN